MKNKPLLLVGFAVIAMALASCADTNELYYGPAYVSPDFASNRYHRWDHGLKEATRLETKILSHAAGDYFSGSGDPLRPGGEFGAQELQNEHPEAFIHQGNALHWTYEGFLENGWYVDGDILNYGAGNYADQSALYGIIYSQTKKMSLYNEKFSRGYLSKLYNGQIRCDGWSSYSLVELDSKGYGTLFPAELSSAPYFAFSARGGSNTPYGSAAYGVKEWGSVNYGSGRLTTFDITITFYKYGTNGSLVGYPFLLDDVVLETNISAEDTSLVGFYFEDVGYDPAGTIGMSMEYSLAADEASWKIEDGEGGYIEETAVTTDDFENARPGEYLTALILLEVLFPDSNWN